MRDFHYKLNLSQDADKRPLCNTAALVGGLPVASQPFGGDRGGLAVPPWCGPARPALSRSPSHSLTHEQRQHRLRSQPERDAVPRAAQHGAAGRILHWVLVTPMLGTTGTSPGGPGSAALAPPSPLITSPAFLQRFSHLSPPLLGGF